MYDNPPIPNIPIIRTIISYLAYRKICSILPVINEWVDELIAETSDQAIPVWERGFDRLSDYYTKELLKAVRVVYTNRCPIPPLKKFGIKALAGYEAWNPEGIPIKIRSYAVEFPPLCAGAAKPLPQPLPKGEGRHIPSPSERGQGVRFAELRNS